MEILGEILGGVDAQIEELWEEEKYGEHLRRRRRHKKAKPDS